MRELEKLEKSRMILFSGVTTALFFRKRKTLSLKCASALNSSTRRRHSKLTMSLRTKSRITKYVW